MVTDETATNAPVNSGCSELWWPVSVSLCAFENDELVISRLRKLTAYIPDPMSAKLSSKTQSEMIPTSDETA